MKKWNFKKNTYEKTVRTMAITAIFTLSAACSIQALAAQKVCYTGLGRQNGMMQVYTIGGNCGILMPGFGNGNNSSGGSTNDSTSTSYATQILNLVNEEREKSGLSPLTLDTSASAAAGVRASEIATNFSHTRPNGASFSTALTEAGASFRSAGENIAYGQTSPSQVMNSWMNSSGHRANILSKNYTRIGIAHYTDASGTDYWVQLFLN